MNIALVRKFLPMPTYGIVKNGSEIGEIYKPAGANFWLMRLVNNPYPLGGYLNQVREYPGLDITPRFDAIKSWIMKNL